MTNRNWPLIKDEVCTMKSFMTRGMSVTIRGGLIGTLVSIVGNSVIADEPVANVDGHLAGTTQDDELVFDEGQDENRPIVELEPERTYASEALLSFRSKVAPYGKVLGIRRTNETEFRVVQVWKDVEDFVAGCDDDRVMIKVREPWGTEVVQPVTINRKRYPGRVRPTMDPPSAPTKPVEVPIPATSGETKPAGTIPVTVAEPKTENRHTPLEVAPPSSGIATSGPSASSRYQPVPVDPKAISIAPAEPGSAQVAARSAKDELTTSPPSVQAPVGSPRNSALRSDPFEPTPLTMAPRSAGPPLSRPPASDRDELEANFSMAAMLALAPVIPIPAGIKEIAASGQTVSFVRVVSTPAKIKSKKLEVKPFEMNDEQQIWLRDAVEMADRMGILSAKPLVTSDRRQNAFALYSLFMALKDYRFEVDLSAKQLEEALGKASPQKIDSMTRSVEKGMASILEWDTKRMESAIRSYSAELSTMGDVRRMVSFLASIKSSRAKRDELEY